VNVNPSLLKTTLRALVATQDHEWTCDEVASYLDRYIEQRIEGTIEATPENKLIDEHLGLCPECREECEAVIRALRNG
jgi:hypothetical protein